MSKAKPLLLFTSPVGTRSGYGSHSRDIVKNLIDMDEFDVKIIDLRWGGTPRNALEKGNPNHQPIIDRLVQQNELPRQPDIHVHLTVPNEWSPVGKYNLGITAGIETTMCSPEWIEGMNRMDLIIVPSNHVKDVFLKTNWTQRDNRTQQPVRQLKLEKPIEVLFEGADLNIYRKMKQGEPYPKKIAEELKNIKPKFNFLYVGHWLKGDLGQDRKDTGMLIKVFLETFKDKKNPPGLILKTSGASLSVMDREEILSKIKTVKSLVKADSLPPIYLLHGDLTDEEMNSLYNHPRIKAHISFTKGEGFGRPLLEASLSGKPVIVSNWSGHVDFLTKAYSTMLPGQLTNVHPSAAWDKVILKESQWFTVNYNFASATMRDIVTNYQKYKVKSEKQAVVNKGKFTLAKMQVEFKKILDKYVPEFANEPTISLPNLPKLKKVGGDGDTPTITLPKLKKADAPTVTLPKLKKAGETPIIKLPKKV